MKKHLKKQGIVSDVRKDKNLFSVADLRNVLVALWTQDDQTFIPERYRIQVTFLLRVFCWTGARVGAFFKGGLRWRVSLL